MWSIHCYNCDETRKDGSWISCNIYYCNDCQMEFIKKYGYFGSSREMKCLECKNGGTRHDCNPERPYRFKSNTVECTPRELLPERFRRIVKTESSPHNIPNVMTREREPDVTSPVPVGPSDETVKTAKKRARGCEKDIRSFFTAQRSMDATNETAVTQTNAHRDAIEETSLVNLPVETDEHRTSIPVVVETSERVDLDVSPMNDGADESITNEDKPTIHHQEVSDANTHTINTMLSVTSELSQMIIDTNNTDARSEGDDDFGPNLIIDGPDVILRECLSCGDHMEGNFCLNEGCQMNYYRIVNHVQRDEGSEEVDPETLTELVKTVSKRRNLRPTRMLYVDLRSYSQTEIESLRKRLGISNLYDPYGKVTYGEIDERTIRNHDCRGEECTVVREGYRTWGVRMPNSSRRSFCCPKNICGPCLRFTNTIPDVKICAQCPEGSRCARCLEDIQHILSIRFVPKKGIPKCDSRNYVEMTDKILKNLITEIKYPEKRDIIVKRERTRPRQMRIVREEPDGHEERNWGEEQDWGGDLFSEETVRLVLG